MQLWVECTSTQIFFSAPNNVQYLEGLGQLLTILRDTDAVTPAGEMHDILEAVV